MLDKTIRTALVTGADRGFGFSVAERLARAGWRVFAGWILPEYHLLDELRAEYPEVHPIRLDVSSREDILAAKAEIEAVSGKLDLLVSNAAIMGGDGTAEVGGEKAMDFDLLEKTFRINSLAAVTLTDLLLPLLEKSEFKRLFFVSSEISSIRLMHRTGDMRYAMSKTALNLGVRMLYNSLRPRGFTFRLYQPGWMKRVLPDGSRADGADIDPDRSADTAIQQIFEDRLDEDRLVLVDYRGCELSF